MTYCKDYCEEKGISTSKLNEAQKTLYYIAENMKMGKSINEEGYKHFQMAIKALEQEPRTGHWIDIMVGDMPAQACDQCKTFYPLSYTGGGHNYCPNCGAMMVEPQESEE